MADLRVSGPLLWSSGDLERLGRKLAARREGSGEFRLGRDLRFVSGPVPPLLAVYDDAILSIGDDVVIGHGVSISCDSMISIGDGCRIAAFTHIIDSDFHVADSDSSEAESQPIVIGRRVRIGECATVLRNTKIGDDVVIDPGSVVFGEVPAGCRVRGAPAAVVEGPP